MVNNKNGKYERVYIINRQYANDWMHVVKDVIDGMDLLKRGIIPYDYITSAKYYENTPINKAFDIALLHPKYSKKNGE